MTVYAGPIDQTSRPSVKLLPCPFCGGEAVLEQCEGIIKGDMRWSVGCVERDGRELCMGYQSLTTYARQAEAIAAWNTRHGEATNAELLAALSGLLETVEKHTTTNKNGFSANAVAWWKQQASAAIAKAEGR